MRVSNQRGYCGEMFESRNSVGAKENNRPELQENLMQKQYLLGLMTWKVTRRNVWWKDIANLQVKRLNNYTQSQHDAWMTINLKKKKMSQLENCLQFAHKLF